MSYKAKTITGAQARVRMLERRIQKMDEMIGRIAAERRLMARLAADTPQFSSPLDVRAAKKIRDRILG